MRPRLLLAGLIPIVLSLVLAISATRAQQDAKESTTEANEPPEVALEVQFITMNEATCQKVGLCCAGSTDTECKTCCGTKAAKNGVKFLSRAQVATLLKTVVADSTANVTTLPHVFLYTGKKGHVEVGEKKNFVTGVTIKTKEGQAIFTPEVEDHWLGSKVELRPVVSADGRYVKLSVKATMDYLESEEVPMLPISVPVTFKQETNGVTRTQMFTQIIQQPKFRTVTIEKEMVLPDYGTAVVNVGKRTREVKQVTPILSDIPYLDHFFTNIGMETECVVMLVKAGIVIEEKPENTTLRK